MMGTGNIRASAFNIIIASHFKTPIPPLPLAAQIAIKIYFSS
jgi:hypothetical protein